MSCSLTRNTTYREHDHHHPIPDPKHRDIKRKYRCLERALSWLQAQMSTNFRMSLQRLREAPLRPPKFDEATASHRAVTLLNRRQQRSPHPFDCNNVYHTSNLHVPKTALPRHHPYITSRSLHEGPHPRLPPPTLRPFGHFSNCFTGPCLTLSTLLVAHTQAFGKSNATVDALPSETYIPSKYEVLEI
jgi:hypothetical protein